MPRVYVLCCYCGCKWDVIVYSQQDTEELVCEICKDSNLKIYNEAFMDQDIFGYNKDGKSKKS